MSETQRDSLDLMRPIAPRSFSGVALGVWLACLGAAAGVQLLVDPFDAYAGWSGFDGYKLFAQRDEPKAEALLRLKPTTLILGTSRAMAFNPASPLWGQGGAFNLGLPAAPQTRVVQAFRMACRKTNVTRVFLCIDFYQYGCDPAARSFERSKLSPDFSAWRFHFENLFSKKSLEAAGDVVQCYLSGRESDFTPWNGLRTGRFYAKTPPRSLFVKTTSGYAKIYDVYASRQAEFQALREIVTECREHGIELIVATAPVHAVHLEIIASRGLWPKYEAWLRETTQIVHDAGGGRTPIWDFAGYHPFNTEPAPSDDQAPLMEFHQEPAHFTTALGELVLERVLTPADAPLRNAAAEVAPEFGERLTPENIEAHLDDLRLARDVWLSTAPAELAFVPAPQDPTVGPTTQLAGRRATSPPR